MVTISTIVCGRFHHYKGRRNELFATGISLSIPLMFVISSILTQVFRVYKKIALNSRWRW